MLSRKNKFILQAAVAGLVLTAIPSSTSAVTEDQTEIDKQLTLFLTVFQRVRNGYVDKVDDKALIKGAIDGMLASLDPHSSYMDGSDFENFKIRIDGNYPGIGASVVMDEGFLKIVAPTEDAPAWTAGLKPGDYITHINGKVVYGSTLDEAVAMLRGEPNTTVKLTIAREGRDEPFDVSVKRAVIDLKPVKWEVKDGIGILNINEFSTDAGKDVRSAIRSIKASLGGKDPIGYIIDLRSDPGGNLNEAVTIADTFLDSGQIVSQRGRFPYDNAIFVANKGDMADGLPIIVLIDAGSASASEIVAGALQDHHRAVIMGERSFGKGSVQTWQQLSENSALKLTTARYFTPSGRSIQEGGIEPDIAVPQLTDPDYAKKPRFRESDLKRHLINEVKVDRAELKKDEKADPRFSKTAEQLKKDGVEDFQLRYALDTMMRIASGPTPGGKVAAAEPKTPAKRK
ncbi:MAG: S41 family peptidase [Sphingobium sp.]|nr:S41 family peptidase [Sphingobium sp.]